MSNVDVDAARKLSQIEIAFVAALTLITRPLWCRYIMRHSVLKFHGDISSRSVDRPMGSKFHIWLSSDLDLQPSKPNQVIFGCTYAIRL